MFSIISQVMGKENGKAIILCDSSGDDTTITQSDGIIAMNFKVLRIKAIIFVRYSGDQA